MESLLNFEKKIGMRRFRSTDSGFFWKWNFEKQPLFKPFLYQRREWEWDWMQNIGSMTFSNFFKIHTATKLSDKIRTKVQSPVGPVPRRIFLSTVVRTWEFSCHCCHHHIPTVCRSYLQKTKSTKVPSFEFKPLCRIGNIFLLSTTLTKTNFLHQEIYNTLK